MSGKCSLRVVFSIGTSCNLSSCGGAEGGSRRQPAMVRAKSYSKPSGSRHRGSYAAPASNGSSKMSTMPSSPRGRCSSVDSLHSRASSYDSLIPSSKDSDMSRHRPPHYGRMVCDAVARLKNRRGATIKDITKNLERKYPYVLKLGSNGTEKVIATAKKLVREGKLVKDGSNYFLSKTSSRKSEDTDDNSSVTSHRNLKWTSGGKQRHSHRGRSHSRGRGRPRNSSRSRSRSKRSRSYSRSRSRSRKVRRHNHRKQRKGRNRYSSARRSLKRGSKRKKKGARKGQTRLATGRRRAHQRKIARARRRVKHTYTRRPKSDKLPDGDGAQAIYPQSFALTPVS